MASKLIVSPSPHIASGVSTSRLMRDVVIALIPSLAVAIFMFGISSLIVTLISVASCIIFEWAITRFLIKKRSTIGDYSATVTGLLLALNLPPEISLWLVVLGALVAIGVAKMSFGGLGNNPFNPALVARVFLLISFAAQMSTFSATSLAPEVVSGATADAFSGATPLAYAKEALKAGKPLSEFMPNFSYGSMLLGDKSGSLGEVSGIALLLGFAYLLFRKVITWHIPVYVLGTMAIFSGILHIASPEEFLSPTFHILSGGALLGAIFMATDYATSPMNKKGILIYGIGIGLITIIIRVWGSYPEGISFAILIMNGVTPLIDKLTKPKRFGAIKK